MAAKFLHADNEVSDQTVQADLSLHLAHKSDGTVSNVPDQMLRNGLKKPS